MTCNAVLSAIQASDPVRGAKIQAGLQHWLATTNLWRKQIDNLCNDPHLPSAACEQLMDLFDGNIVDETALRQTYEAKCRQYPLSGPSYGNFPSDRMLWNSVGEKTLRKRLDKAFGRRSDWAFRTLLRDSQKVVGNRKARKAKMSLYNVWGTWNISNGGYPFPTWYDGDHVRASLGLSEMDRHQPLYVIGYQMPTGFAAHVPTAADAGNFPYFKPNVMGTPGYTDPWHPKPDLKDNKGAIFTATPCPEVVHSPGMFTLIREVTCLTC